jgi:hypothetical protein
LHATAYTVAGTLMPDMADDDWRIRIDVAEEEHAEGFLERLGGGLGSEARELARDLEAQRLAVSRDGETIFVYASSRPAAESAEAIVQAELRDHGIEATTSRIEHWLDEEDRWDDEPPGETWEQEEVERGFAPWEVRVETASREEARELEEQLVSEGYRPERTFRYVVVGTDTREEADALAGRLHGSVEPGGEVVWETTPENPFAIFGGLGG